jgi:peptidoglycan/LPS O-acetylase OafA/YrhL
MDAVFLASTLVIAELSWRLVERRFLARRPLPRDAPAPQPAITPEPILVQT